MLSLVPSFSKEAIGNYRMNFLYSENKQIESWFVREATT